MFGLGLLAASNSLFDDAFAKARGAHATVAFDSGKVSVEEVAATAHAAGVTAAAGPFRTAVLPRGQGMGPMRVGGEGFSSSDAPGLGASGQSDHHLGAVGAGAGEIVDVAAAGGILVLVVLAAVVPAMRAGRL